MVDPKDLSRLDRKALITLWCEIVGTPPAPRLRAPMMRKILACDLQWKAAPSNRAALRRRFDKAIKAKRHNGVSLQEGDRLVRDWNGVRHTVDVVADGFRWNDHTWTSLSAIAREITGTRWSGPRFFGVAA